MSRSSAGSNGKNYTPGDVTPTINQHPNRSELYEKQNTEMQLEAAKKNGIETTIDGNKLKPIDIVPSRRNSSKLREERAKSAFAAAFHNFQTARRMHHENLDHQPLPDAVLEKKFSELQAQGDFGLDFTPVTGVGYKGYKVGPTQCTKLKVYRPKTCGVLPKNVDKSTMSDLENSDQIKLDKKLTSMDLAIRWDYRPKKGREPKLPRHIDGSNDIVGSIFTKVQESKGKENTIPQLDRFERAEGIFHNTQGEIDFFDRDLVLKRRDYQRKYEKERECTCGTDVASFANVPGSESITNKNRPKTTKSDSALYSSSSGRSRRCKSSPNLSMIANPRSTTDPGSINTVPSIDDDSRKIPVTQLPRETEQQKKISRQPRFAHHTIPKLCEQMRQDYEKMMKKYFLTQELIKMDENNNEIIVEPKIVQRSKNKAVVHAPRPKQPYKIRNYHIDSLAPPFSSWTGKGSEYPNHWRLSSIYQQAYKPVESRKRPFLQSIYR
ncbi:hypothetical protein PVAND_011132 [Polypedilum vanderplanki]|uniref:DUF4812 domain-containing protein n=1 Tax=Polypedilum vanderplanki TaxID=319348 RepID=A0A9J6CHN4_POLVA|nr:hypothetical protein PVAND_011132 [Polypedilum vanderplanki]